MGKTKEQSSKTNKITDIYPNKVKKMASEDTSSQRTNVCTSFKKKKILTA